ncbi:MAG: SH3 domain-containing protein [Thermodesulfobacteriota bacterium]
MRKYIVFPIISVLLFSGCQGIIRQPLFQKPQPAMERETGRSTPAAARETVSGPVTLYEAMARAVQHNLRSEVEKMGKALDRAGAAASDYESLVDLVRAAGYGYSESSVDTAAGSKTRPFSGADARRTDIAAIWNVLDFGLLYAVTREGIQPVSESQGIRQKAVRNILHETRRRYYRAAGAEALASEIGRLLGQAREALRVTREINRRSSSPSREALETQRELIETIRGLREWMGDLSPAKIDLAEWMGLNPGSGFRLVAPAWNQPNIPSLKKSRADLEHLALVHRWEARGGGMSGDGGVARTREAMLRLQPELDFDSEGPGPGDDPWLAGREWREIGLRLIPGLVMPGSASNPLATRVGGADDPRRLAVNAAILTQVHLARQRFEKALEDYRLSYLLDDVNTKLQTESAGGPVSGSDGLSMIRRSRDLLQARMRHYLAFTELENAAFRLYNTVGVDPLPPVEDTLGTASLARYLDRSMDRWEGSLNSAQSVFSRTDRGTSPNPTASGREVPPVSRRSESSGSAPPSGPSDTAPFARGTPVIDAAEAAREGRRPVKEVEVYRDVVNIRNAPGNNAQVKGQGLIGETYRMTGWTPDGWLKIEMMDGSFGWIPTKYVRPVDEPVSGAEETLSEAAAGTGSTLKLIATTTRANVRSGPGLDHPVKYVEAAGSRHNVREETGPWYRIRARDGSEGWLHESVVQVLAGN